MPQATAQNIEDLPAIASQIIDQYRDRRVFLFNGEMGAGKTTLIKELCKVLQVRDNISSPTFSIVNEYKGVENRVYHFDFYRLEDIEEAIHMGAEDYFFSGDYCFIEWPDLVNNLLPSEEKCVWIDIFVKEGVRSINF